MQNVKLTLSDVPEMSLSISNIKAVSQAEKHAKDEINRLKLVGSI